MKSIQVFVIIMVTAGLSLYSQSGNNDIQENRVEIEKTIGAKEYTRLMELSIDEFDQSNVGFRLYSDNYALICLLIPEYIYLNNLSVYEAANLHWHLGQMHAFNDNIEKAINEMELSVTELSSIYWKCYVEGTIAFLNKDKTRLTESLETLKKQENQMNIEFLEKFVTHFNEQYWDAYHAE